MDMKNKLNIAVIIALIFLSLSCINKQKRVNSNEGNKEEQINISDSLDAGMYISKSILGINMGIKSISSSELNSLNYNQLFTPKGVLNIVAYYDKRPHQLNQPTKFEDFLMFVVNYDNSQNAKIAFERIKSDAALSNLNKQIEIDEQLSDRIEFLKVGEKYGGLITCNGNQVFSLIENCENSPLNKSWLELEYMFTDQLKNKNGFVEVLKAGCNEGKYYGGRRKASS